MILLLSLLLVAGILGWLYWRYRVPAQVHDLLRTPSLSELAPIGEDRGMTPPPLPREEEVMALAELWSVSPVDLAPAAPGRGVGILGVLPHHSLEESLRKLS